MIYIMHLMKCSLIIHVNTEQIFFEYLPYARNCNMSRGYNHEHSWSLIDGLSNP